MASCRAFIPVNINIDVILPKRMTAYAAGYDFFCPYDDILPPKTPALIPTYVAAIMPPDEVLMIYIRSSLACKNIILRNSVAIIDADYYKCPATNGNIILHLFNDGNEPFKLRKGDRIAQGIFQKYFTTYDDHACGDRVGGGGSTGV